MFVVGAGIPDDPHNIFSYTKNPKIFLKNIKLCYIIKLSEQSDVKGKVENSVKTGRLCHPSLYSHRDCLKYSRICERRWMRYGL